MADDRRVDVDEDTKSDRLNMFREEGGEYLTANHGVRINHTDDSLRAGIRGPTIMEDFHFREKMTHFDHERIPERVVHARGSAAHGYFELYDSMENYTKAKFLTNTSSKTPVFVRFSTVVGFRGSADTVRDVRGFATKFYTEDGNFDLVGNNMPVFFIQDGIKFPDLVHAIKPEPHNEMPQASAAHDNFWDFASLMPEITHMLMWVLSDRALPRSYRMMEGFGVHTFRLINEKGKAHFVKFHWKPKLGVHSLTWDETQKLAGKDPDFNRRDLWESIEMGDYPEFELGFQIIEEKREHKFDFDLLDPTKLVPEEEVPVIPVGRMVLNRNPDNFFAETEQVAFHPGHVVPGIDFTNDPLLQGRLFSYIDTQLTRLGGPNFQEIPINRPVAPVHNNQRDGFMRQTINKGRSNYYPNSIGGGCPMMAPEHKGGFTHYMEKIDGRKIRERSESFKDYYSQATLFWNSLSEVEQQHLVDAAHFELGKVKIMAVRERMVEQFNHVDHDFACRVAVGIGVAPPKKEITKNHGKISPALSQHNTVIETIQSRQVAIVVDQGFHYAQFMDLKDQLESAGAHTKVVSKFGGMLHANNGEAIAVDETFMTTGSIMFDAVFVPGGQQSVDALKTQGDAIHFVNEAFKHCKPIAASGEGVDLLLISDIAGVQMASRENEEQLIIDKGVLTQYHISNMRTYAREFERAIGKHRHWERDQTDQVPA